MLATLLVIAEENDREKVRFLYDNFHNDMLIFAKGRLKDAKRTNYQTEAEDAVQNTFIRLIRYIHRIDFSKPKIALRTYVLTVLSNEISEMLSQVPESPVTPEMLDSTWEDTFYEELNLEKCRERVAEALRRLDPQFTLVLILRFFEERSVLEIAEFLGISPKTVYYRLMRAKEELLKEIKEVL